MTDLSFDPYHRWLGIPPKHQPPDYYRLLALEQFEDDEEVIRDGAEQRIAHVRHYCLGEHAERAQELLKELGRAKACLLDRKKKADYDARLRGNALDQGPSGDVSASEPDNAKNEDIIPESLNQEPESSLRCKSAEPGRPADEQDATFSEPASRTLASRRGAILVAGVCILVAIFALVFLSGEFRNAGGDAAATTPEAERKLKRLETEVARLEKELTAARQALNPKPQIPRTATTYKGHRYAVFETPVVHRMAMSSAEQLGGHLVRIEDADENKFVAQLIQGGRHESYWMDGTDDVQNGLWIFSNGERMDYTNWDSGEPGNGRGEWSCAVQASGKMHDHYADDKNGFIVEWDE